MSQLALADVDTLPPEHMRGRGGALDYWPTPDDLAERVVRTLGLCAGTTVIEPSAGTGSLVRPLVETGAEVTAIEIDPLHEPALRASGPAELLIADFLALEPPRKKFDLCVMNPPFANGMDCAFLERSMAWANATVAILRTHALHGKERHERVWSRCAMESIAFLVGRPSFGGGSPHHEFCVVAFLPRKSHWKVSCLTEWWT